MQRPELLAPAGNLEKLKIAVLYGADAVYLAGKKFGLRAAAGNFSPGEMAEGISFAHERGAKVFVTVNIFARNSDFQELPPYIREIAAMGADGVIAADPGIIALVKEVAPGLPVHLSTQANTTNGPSVLFWARQGVSRVVLARELSLGDIAEIKKMAGIEIEIFIHGAMCISYSGRCLLSNYLIHRDANRGECAQPCRWKYALVEETRPGQYFPLQEEGQGSFIFNSHDLSTIERLPEILDAGVDSLKIEGRMKSVHYVATVVKAYREAMDAYLEGRLETGAPETVEFLQGLSGEVAKVSHRPYTSGFYFGLPQPDEENYARTHYIREYRFAGLVREYRQDEGIAVVEQRGHFGCGDRIEITGPGKNGFTQEVREMWDEEGNPIERAPHPQQIVRLKVDKPVSPWDMLRVVPSGEQPDGDVMGGRGAYAAGNRLEDEKCPTL